LGFVVKIPRLAIPALKISKGFLFDRWLGPLHVVIPPEDITFWEEIVLLEEITVFDSDWIWKFWTETIDKIEDARNWIINKVWEWIMAYLDRLAEEWYAKRGAK